MALHAVGDMTLDRAVGLTVPGSEASDILFQLHARKQQVEQEQARFRTNCDRFDKLYYAEDFTSGGADLWADHPSASLKGRAHVSVNTPAAYVDIPASLQAVEPIENMLATDTDEAARTAAQHFERVYYSWKREEDWESLVHRACVTKGLYGRTAAYIYWEEPEDGEKEGHPCVEIIDQPRHLYLGWKSNKYDELAWCAYVQRMTPDAVMEEFSVEVGEMTTKDKVVVPFVMSDAQPSRPWLNREASAAIEVWNYWYLRPKARGRKGYRTEMQTVNAVFAGNELVRFSEHDEYGGKIPVIPLFNTYIPGVPDGRSDLYDVEQIIREKYERITAGSQMIAGAIGGQFWQLVGPETTPGNVPPSARPKINEVISPGPSARIEAISPFLPEVQLEQYLDRLDREAAVITGLNDLLLGLAPAQVLSSSKAINALIANYETRIAMRRTLLYKWRKDVWDLVSKVWKNKSSTIRTIVDAGGGVLDIIDPSLSPRDEMETMTRAINAVNGKVWSLSRAMDAVGVDDPEQEVDIIKKERTDASLFPADVQTMAQLISILRSLQQPTPDAAQGQVDATLRNAGAAATPGNTTGSQLAGDQGMMPLEAGTPPPGGGLGAQPLIQSMIQGGKSKDRILVSNPAPRPTPAPVRKMRK